MFHWGEEFRSVGRGVLLMFLVLLVSLPTRSTPSEGGGIVLIRPSKATFPTEIGKSRFVGMVAASSNYTIVRSKRG